MKKGKNVIKRNSGFIAGCILAAGVSYFTADVVMTKGIQALQMTEDETPSMDETGTAETLAPETARDRVIETDPFTVTASGNIIKGVDPEVPQTKDTENETDPSYEDGENSGQDSGSSDGGSDSAGDSGDIYYDDGSGSYSGTPSYDGSYSDGSYSDGSYSDGSYSDGSYSDGSYSGDGYSDNSYSDNSYGDSSSGGSYDGPVIEIQDPGGGYADDGSGGGDSSGGDTEGTPSDVIIWGISSRYIDESELYNYDAGQLRLIRNEIFALNGRIFNSQDLMDYFSQKSWYVPMYSPEEFDANMFYYLNDYEVANLNVILNYEEALAGGE